MSTVNNKNTRTASVTCSNAFIVNFEYFTPFTSISIIDFEHVLFSWDYDIYSLSAVFQSRQTSICCIEKVRDKTSKKFKSLEILHRTILKYCDYKTEKRFKFTLSFT